MPAATQKIELVALDSLRPHPRNPRQGDIGAVMTSIARNGWFGAVLVQRVEGQEDTIVAGEHRWRALGHLFRDGWTDPDSETHLSYAELAQAVPLPAAGKVPVIAHAWTDEQALRILLADNRTSDLGTYDESALAAILTEFAEDGGLLGTGYDGDDLDAILAGLDAEAAAESARGRHAAADEAPRPPTHPVSQVGDVWILGDHRLVCGDATDEAAYRLLLDGGTVDMVWTDPPYGVALDRRPDRLVIPNDDLGANDLQQLVTAAFTLAAANCRPGATWWVAAPAGPNFALFADPLRALDIWRQTVIWVKDQFVLGRSDYHYRHETVFYGWTPGDHIPPPDRPEGDDYRPGHEDLIYGWTPGAAHDAPPDRRQDTIWEIPRPPRSEQHPTMKPIELVARAIRNHTQPGGLVLDPFAGSGSTLMAAEQEGRIARCIELSPAFCDVICERFERHDGVVPVRFGEPVSFLG